MEKKSTKSTDAINDNSSGTVSVVFATLSLIFSFLVPPFELIFGVVGFIFAKNQEKKSFKGWAKIGVTLSIVGVVLSLLIWILVATILAPQMEQYLAQYAAGQ